MSELQRQQESYMTARARLAQAGAAYHAEIERKKNPEGLPLVATKKPRDLLRKLREESDEYHDAIYRLSTAAGLVIQAIENGEFDCPHPNDIIAQVCADHNLTILDLTGLSRVQHVVHARHELCYRLRHETPLNNSQIAKIIRRDHSTVYHALIQHETRMAGNR